MLEQKNSKCEYCKGPLSERGKYWVCNACKIVAVDATGYKTMEESVFGEKGEIAIFLKQTSVALEKYDDNGFRERAIRGTLSAVDNELLDFSSKLHIAKSVLESCGSLSKKLTQQELYQVLSLMGSSITKKLLKENNDG